MKFSEQLFDYSENFITLAILALAAVRLQLVQILLRNTVGLSHFVSDASKQVQLWCHTWWHLLSTRIKTRESMCARS
jgi:hypothetical protein